MRRLALACLALTLSACKCGKPAVPAADVGRYLPKDADLAVVVPEVGALGDKLKILEQLKIASFLAGTQGFGSADELVSNVVNQVGVDLRSREAISKAGVEPSRGFGVAFLHGGQAYSVVGVSDAQKLEATLATLAKNRLGASVAHVKDEGGARLTFWSQANSGDPQLGYTVREGVAFIAAGAVVNQLPRLAALPPEQSLAQEPALAAALARLGTPRDVFAYVPQGSSYARPGMGGSAYTASLSPQALTVRADVPWPNTQKSLEVLDKKSGPNLLGYLPQNAFLVARFDGDPGLLAPFWPLLVGPYVERAAREAGFDVKAEVLDNLQPGIVVSLGVAPTARMGAMPDLDVRRTNPFRYLELAAVAGVKDPAKAQATLAKLPPIAERFGAKVEPADRNGKKVYLTHYVAGEGTDFALVGNKVTLAAPLAQFDQLVGRLGGAPGPGPLQNGAVRQSLDAHALGAVVDLHQLAESVKALPSEAWGIGGFAIKATTVRWLDATDDLQAITAGLSAKEGAIQGELSLRFVAK